MRPLMTFLVAPGGAVILAASVVVMAGGRRLVILGGVPLFGSRATRGGELP